MLQLGVAMCGLSGHHQPFDLHHDGIGTDDEVQTFRCIVGQDRKLIHVGDYMKLSRAHCEVWYVV